MTGRLLIPYELLSIDFFDIAIKLSVITTLPTCTVVVQAIRQKKKRFMTKNSARKEMKFPKEVL